MQLLTLVMLNVLLCGGLATAATPHTASPDWVARGKYGGILKTVATAEPDHWDLHQACCNPGPGAARDLFNALIMYNPVNASEIVGDLAERWEVSADGQSYMFSLHEASWWDGQPVTADDVKFSLERMMEPGKIRPRIGVLRDYIREVHVVDARTVRLVTKFPTPPALLPLLATDYAVIYPKHVLETGVDFDEPKNIVGSGPFRLKSYQRGQSWVVVKNPTYFKKGLPFLDGVQTFVIRNAARVIAAFQAEQVLMCNRAGSCGLSTKDNLDLEKAMRGKGVFHWQEAGQPTGINLNFTRPPFDDPRVRRAVYLTIDRQEIVQVHVLGRGTVGTPFYPNTWMSSSTEEVLQWPGFRQPKDADIAAAKQLLTEAGYPEGFKTSLIAATNNETLALLLKQQLKRVGLDVDLKLTDSNTLYAAQAQGDYAITAIRHGPSIIDPDDLFQAMFLPGGPRNQLNWEDPHLTELYVQQSREPDQHKRRAILLQAESILRQGETPWMTLMWGYDNGNLIHHKLKNYHKPPTVHTAMTHEHLWLEDK